MSGAARIPGGGRFPGFDAAAQAPHWDPVTAGVVLSRLGMPPDIRFFTPAEEAVATALCDRAARPGRRAAGPGRAVRSTRGWPSRRPTAGATRTCPRTARPGGTPWPPRRRRAGQVLAARFAECEAARSARRSSRPSRISGSSDWHGLDAGHVWSLWTRYACTAFYAHPSAWNEIGFPGPGVPARLQERRHRRARAVRGPRRQPVGRPGAGRQPDDRRARPQRVGLAAAERRHPHQPPAAHGHAPVRRHRRGRPGDCRLRRGRLDAAAAAGPAGWRVVGLDAGPFWDPDADWVSDEAGSHHLYWTEPRVIGGADPVPLGSNNSGRGVGGSMVHYAGYTPRFHPSDFRTFTRRRGRRGLADRLPGPEALLRGHRGGTAGRGGAVAVGRPALLPAPAAPGRRQRRDLPARRAQALGITAKVGPVAIANGRFGNRPHCIYRGFCLQGCKVNAKASPLITHIPDALAHGAEVRADAMVTRVEVDERTGRATGVHYVRGGVPRFQRAGDGRGRRLLDRDAAAAAQLGLAPVPGRPVQRLRPGRPLPDGPGRAADRRPVRRRGPDVQGAAARGQQRGVLRDRPGQALPARVLHPDRVAAADHLGRARRRPGPLGPVAARVHERLRALVLPGGAVRVPAAAGQPGHPRRGEGPPRPARRPLLLLPVRQRPPADEGRPGRSWRTSCTPPAPTRSSPSTATPTWSAAPGWPPTSGTASSTRDCRTFAVPNLYITDGSVLPTQGSANPALTIMAVAARAADRLAAGARSDHADRAPHRPRELEEETPMAAPTVADYLLERLRDWGVDKVFAFPGDGINGILAAWGRADNQPKFVQSRHEEMSAFEAVGYAKFTGRVGVCMATSGPGRDPPAQRAVRRQARPRPGRRHRRADQPVGDGRLLPAGSRPAQPVQGRRQRLRADGHRPRAAAERAGPGDPGRARRAGADGDHHPLRRPGTGVLRADARVQDGPLQHRASTGPTAVPDDDAIARAADILNAGSKVAILAGQGARGARAELEQVAELLGAGVAKALLGKDVLPDDLPYVTGSIGLLGTRPSYEMMKDCDTLLDRRVELPLHAVPARLRPGPRGADRHRRQVHRHALPLRGQPRRRRCGHAAGPHPAPAAQGGPGLARGHRGQRRPLVGGHGGRGHGGGRPGQPDAAVPRAVRPAARTTRSSPPTPARRRTGTPGS